MTGRGGAGARRGGRRPARRTAGRQSVMSARKGAGCGPVRQMHLAVHLPPTGEGLEPRPDFGT